MDTGITPQMYRKTLSRYDSSTEMTSFKSKGSGLEVSRNCITTATHSNMVPNLYHDFAVGMTFKELLNWLSESEHVTSLLLAIEAVCVWCNYKTHCVSEEIAVFLNTDDLLKKLTDMMASRRWSKLPAEF